MKTNRLFKKENFLLVLLFITGFSFGQITTINIPLPEPCSSLQVVDKIREFDFAMYPNPSKGIVIVELNINQVQQNPRIRVSDMLGRIIYEKNDFGNTSSQNYKLELDSLPAGIYLVIVQIHDRISTKKLLINK